MSWLILVPLNYTGRDWTQWTKQVADWLPTQDQGSPVVIGHFSASQVSKALLSNYLLPFLVVPLKEALLLSVGSISACDDGAKNPRLARWASLSWICFLFLASVTRCQQSSSALPRGMSPEVLSIDIAEKREDLR